MPSKRPYRRKKNVVPCPLCQGTGEVKTDTVRETASNAGYASYLVSLEPGEKSMSDRGSMGGRPQAWHLQEKRPDLYVEVARDPAGNLEDWHPWGRGPVDVNGGTGKL